MSNADETRIGPGRSLRRLALLAVVGIAWLQVAAATHAFEHVGSAAADVCEVCAQFDRSGDVPIAEPAGASVPVAERHHEDRPVLAPAMSRCLPIRQRAPPSA